MVLTERLRRLVCGPDEEGLLAAAAFTVGAGTMAVELTASRLLAPYFGASVFIWTGIIVCVLTAASLGYWFGGRLAEKDAGLRLVGKFLVAAGLVLVLGALLLPILAGLAYALFAGADGPLLGVFAGALFVSVAIFAPPVFLASALSPVLMKRWSVCRDVGRASSRYFLVSTGGSILGTLAPTLVLIPRLGVSATVAIVAGGFMAVGMWLYAVGGGRRQVIGLLFLPLAFAMMPPSETLSGVIRREDTAYQLVRVLERGGRRYLTFNESLAIQSVFDPQTPVTGYYYDYFSLLPQLRPGSGPVHHGAIIGLAAGSAVGPYRMGAAGRAVELTGVELDPAVTKMARADFGLDPNAVRIVNGDGRMFLKTTEERFDGIVLDAYTNRHVAVDLATREFFSLAKSRLTPGGALAMNIIEYVPDDPLYRSLLDTLESVFADVQVVTIQGGLNRIVFASDAPLDMEAAAAKLPADLAAVRDAALAAKPAPRSAHPFVLTDDRAPVEFLSAEFKMKRNRL